jgi:hypothetical protein
MSLVEPVHYWWTGLASNMDYHDPVNWDPCGIPTSHDSIHFATWFELCTVQPTYFEVHELYVHDMTSRHSIQPRSRGSYGAVDADGGLRR